MAITLLLLVLVPGVSARLDFIEIDTDQYNAVELVIYQLFPDHPVPIGHEFVWTVQAFSGVNQFDEVQITAWEVGGDCEIVTATENQFTDTFAEMNITIRMTGHSCWFQAGASGSDAPLLGGTVDAHGHVSGNVVSSTFTSVGQPENSLTDFWLPMTAALGLLIWGVFRSLNHTPVWFLVPFMAFFAVLTAAITDLPNALRIEHIYLFIGVAVWTLLVFIFKGLGFVKPKPSEEE